MPSNDSDEMQKSATNYDLVEDAASFIEIDRDLINKAIRIKQAVFVIYVAACVSLIYNDSGRVPPRRYPIWKDVMIWQACLLLFNLFVLAATRLKPWEARNKLKWLPLIVLCWRPLDKPSRQQVELYVGEAGRWRLEEIRAFDTVAHRRVACAVTTGSVWSMVETYESAGLDYFEEMGRMGQ